MGDTGDGTEPNLGPSSRGTSGRKKRSLRDQEHKVRSAVCATPVSEDLLEAGGRGLTLLALAFFARLSNGIAVVTSIVLERLGSHKLTLNCLPQIGRQK